MVNGAGSSSARLECLLWEQEVVSSNLAYPTESRVALFFLKIPAQLRAGIFYSIR